MTTPVRSLEERIRSKVEAEVRQEITDATRPIAQLTSWLSIRVPGLAYVKHIGQPIEPPTVQDLLAEIEEALKTALLPKRLNRALDDHMDEIARVKQENESLRFRVTQLEQRFNVPTDE